MTSETTAMLNYGAILAANRLLIISVRESLCTVTRCSQRMLQLLAIMVVVVE